MKHFLFFILLVGLVSCAKNEVTPTIPANTLRLTVRSKQVTFPARPATIVLSAQGMRWALSAKAADADSTTISIDAASSEQSLEAPATYSGILSNSPARSANSVYGYRVPLDFNNACGTTIYQGNNITYTTTSIPYGLTNGLPEFTLTIITVDAVAHTMSGTFAGTYWKGCDKLAITDGQFNLPYTVKP